MVTAGRKKSSVVSTYNRRTHGYDEQRSRAEAYAHMNNGQFEPTSDGRPGGRTNTGI